MDSNALALAAIVGAAFVLGGADDKYDRFSDCIEDKMGDGMSQEKAIKICRSIRAEGGIRGFKT